MGTVSRLLRSTPSPLRKLIYRTVPFGYRYGPTFNATLEDLKLIGRDNEAYQDNKLWSVRRFAQDRAPFYKHHNDIITKTDVLENFHSIRSMGNPPRPTTLKTSGTSGVPLRMPADKSIYELEAAHVEDYLNSLGTTLYFGGTVVYLRRYCPHEGEPIHYYDHEQRRLYISAFHIGSHVCEILDLIDNSRARLIMTYPSAAYLLAQAMGSRQFKHVTHIIASSETSLPEWDRLVNEKALYRCYYGQMERVAFWGQDLNGNYQEDKRYGFTEILDNHVIATGFLNPYFPLLRYDTGDLFVEGRFVGRTGDFLVNAEGFPVPPVNFYSLFRDLPIKLWRLTQTSNKPLLVELVAKPAAATEEAIHEGIRQRLGLDCRIEYVDAIDRSEQTGKLKLIQRLS